ncbi:hypothetical protein ZOD2009_12492 [Haladaptatus paucihalophilus DX253]|uniref:DUF7837 domain-containing protein n=1 Tax=Haladaptatus paucihalophilus DX253 TaxID=797209 RepID=E7QUL4_HALPU|nr:hypothetical protein ZOD2009_12492 [Haladaptatus paucihalophilus DX253]SHJ97497.1 hypothetical protein SAMN05444342_0130 [Haladaptatus paucihalophilus DX253]
MATESSRLGMCPNCGNSITSGYLLIEYDTEDGSERFAECPSCEDIVHPAH